MRASKETPPPSPKKTKKTHAPATWGTNRNGLALPRRSIARSGAELLAFFSERCGKAVGCGLRFFGGGSSDGSGGAGGPVVWGSLPQEGWLGAESVWNLGRKLVVEG